MEKVKSSNLIINYLKGRYELVISFWAIYVFAYSMLQALLFVVAKKFQFTKTQLLVSIIPFWLFFSIGCWNSSNNYKGKKIWVFLTKLSIILQGLGAINVLLIYLNIL